jgi:hypothetical protein
VISPVLRGSLDLAHGLEEPAVAHDGVGQEDLGGREERCAASGTKSRRKGGFLGSGTGQKCVSSPVADDVESLPANGSAGAADTKYRAELEPGADRPGAGRFRSDASSPTWLH